MKVRRGEVRREHYYRSACTAAMPPPADTRPCTLPLLLPLLPLLPLLLLLLVVVVVDGGVTKELTAAEWQDDNVRTF